MSIVPSPQSTFVDATDPSGSDAEIERVTDWPELGAPVNDVKVTIGGRSVMVIWEDVSPVKPALSVTVRVTVYTPDVPNVWLVVEPTLDDPSPNVHDQETIEPSES